MCRRRRSRERTKPRAQALRGFPSRGSAAAPVHRPATDDPSEKRPPPARVAQHVGPSVTGPRAARRRPAVFGSGQLTASSRAPPNPAAPRYGNATPALRRPRYGTAGAALVRRGAGRRRALSGGRAPSAVGRAPSGPRADRPTEATVADGAAEAVRPRLARGVSRAAGPRRRSAAGGGEGRRRTVRLACGPYRPGKPMGPRRGGGSPSRYVGARRVRDQLASSAAMSRVMLGSTGMPGPIVELKVTFFR